MTRAGDRHAPQPRSRCGRRSTSRRGSRRCTRACAVELLPLSTRGDELLDQRLDQVGGKGLFIKELENALADGRADLAVHSMKDVPADLPPGFVLAAILEREDPRDAFVSNKSASWPTCRQAPCVGTSSLRRAAQIAERYPALELKLLRGNVETRLAKLDRGEYDAIVLAVAGLVRLGLAARIRARLEPDDEPARAGPGRAGHRMPERPRTTCWRCWRRSPTRRARACVRAERAVSLALGGSCTLPLGAYAELLRRAGSACARSWPRADGRRVVRAEREAATTRKRSARGRRRPARAAAPTEILACAVNARLRSPAAASSSRGRASSPAALAAADRDRRAAARSCFRRSRSRTLPPPTRCAASTPSTSRCSSARRRCRRSWREVPTWPTRLQAAAIGAGTRRELGASRRRRRAGAEEGAGQRGAARAAGAAARRGQACRRSSAASAARPLLGDTLRCARRAGRVRRVLPPGAADSRSGAAARALAARRACTRSRCRHREGLENFVALLGAAPRLLRRRRCSCRTRASRRSARELGAREAVVAGPGRRRDARAAGSIFRMSETEPAATPPAAPAPERRRRRPARRAWH